MFMSRRALLSMLGASFVSAAFGGAACAKGGGGKGAGRDGAMDIGTGLVPSSVSGTNPKQVRTFKLFEGKACRRDYARLCPTIPMGKCDLAGRIEQLSPACRKFVQNHG
ncbi:hypothetical protein [Mesorhizobium sp. WSM4906]|uniref:hypothetical protein n=1 Tax=Mesorhizobium sp. WSM4906 TaxID=3038546 RepID=UPI002415BCF3|nr:hypothetical protein [Mesorhizobium sp. WSM4906]WFP74968.1 hypothetical protein QAZ22_25045 [Mesorhizobium sp. WSM4906]